MHLRLVGARLFRLLRLLRESGLPVYEREIGHKEIHRQLIIMIGFSGGLSSQQIVALTGHEKAQVSRAIKPLEQAGFIGRERLRAKFTLLPPGQAIFERIMAIGRVRDGVLTAGLAAADLRRFAGITEQLTAQAALMYAEERRLSGEAGIISACTSASGALPPWPNGPDGRASRPPSTLITPKLISLAAYMKRSAMLAYQRTHGLSHFQWHVLSLVADCPPMPLAQLILIMGRDKSQVGRTVSYLERAGLIVRSRPTRRRDILLEPTPAGAEMFRSMDELAMKREAEHWSAQSADNRAFYIAMLEKLTDNAQAMVEREAAAS